MEKSVKITGIISSSVIVLALIIIWTVFQFMPSSTLSVSGQSEIKVVPDLISVNFNINAKGKSASEAKDAGDEIYDKLVLNLVSAGISEDDVKTTSLSVQQDYEWVNGKRIDRGYVANHYVVVELSTDDSDKIGDVIDAGVSAEALLSYINFELSPEVEKEKKSEAIQLATEDARTKAEAMAEGSGQKLGRVVSISDSNWGYSPFPVFRSVDESMVASEVGAIAKEAIAEVGITPSEQIVYGNVNVVWKIR